MDCFKTLVLPKHPINLFPPSSSSSSSSSSASKLSHFPFTLQFTRPKAASSSSSTTTKTPSSSKPKPTKTKTTDNITPSTHVPTKKVLVPVAFGTEEMEVVIIAAVLRSAGAEVTVASVEQQLEVQGSGGTRLVADASISDCSDIIFDLVALPGGMPGSARLRDCEILQQITSKQAEEKRLYGAICAAPAVTLQPWGLLRRKRTTCHPAFSDKLPTFWAVKSNIQISGELTTSRGPGTSFEFALSLAEQLFGECVAKEVRETLLIHDDDDENFKKEEFNKVEWSVHHMPSVLIPVANGSEEIDVVTIIDILRRAKVDVMVASVEKSKQILASRGTKLVADMFISDAADSVYDMIILPGGTVGAERLHKSKILKKLLQEQVSAGRIYGAICSSPVLLGKRGLLKDKKASAHPSVIGKLPNQVMDGAKIVIDGKVITSWGLAAVADFSLNIVSKLFGHARARSVAEGLVLEFPRN